MTRARVLIVDDSAVSRRFLIDVVASDPKLELAGVATATASVLAKIAAMSPDVAVISFSVLNDGVEAVRAIREAWPKLPILMCRALSDSGAEVTMRALAAGASDTISMPGWAPGRESIVAFASFSVKLVAKLHLLTASNDFTLRPPPAPSIAPPRLAPTSINPSWAPRNERSTLSPPKSSSTSSPRPSTPSSSLPTSAGATQTWAHAPSSETRTLAPRVYEASLRPPMERGSVAPAPSIHARAIASATPVEVLAIGISTGGPDALAKIFPDLPNDLDVPILIVQHMPPLFTRLLAERLTRCSRLLVVEATDRELVLPNRAYIAPGDFHMTVVRDGDGVRIVLNRDEQENSCRPAVDVLFRSVAKVYGSHVLAAVLTGMGHDGTRGAFDVVGAGGSVIVQDAASCVVASMPSSVLAAGLASRVVPLDHMAAELTMRTRRSKARAVIDAAGSLPTRSQEGIDTAWVPRIVVTNTVSSRNALLPSALPDFESIVPPKTAQMK